MSGVSGYIVRGRGSYASASIFLPAAGRGYMASLGSAGSGGYYWSSVLDSGSYYAWSLGFHSGDSSMCGIYRGSGRSIRPVQEFTK